MERHIVTTTPADGPNRPRATLHCETCKETVHSELEGNELQKMAHTDTTWHRTSR